MSQATIAAGERLAPGWLRSARFDGGFIFGIAALALLSGLVVVQNPKLFPLILFIDIWLLGYHHVISTFTRLAFDGQSRREHAFLLYGLPPLVLAGVLLMAGTLGFWSLATLYFYWQWFHYSRQSWGVAQAYRRKAGGIPGEPERLAKAAFYMVPLWGILSRSHQNPETFLGLELRVVPIASIVVDVFGVIAVALLIWWIAQRIVLWRQGRLPVAHTAFMISHFVIFYVGYIAIESVDYGWLVLNVWHNAQYIAFVWLFNTNRYKNGVEKGARLISWLSQPHRALIYGGFCFGLSTVIYLAIEHTSSLLPLLPIIVIYQTINFHHYIVDGLIWKVRKPALQKTLGLDR